MWWDAAFQNSCSKDTTREAEQDSRNKKTCNKNPVQSKHQYHINPRFPAVGYISSGFTGEKSWLRQPCRTKVWSRHKVWGKRLHSPLSACILCRLLLEALQFRRNYLRKPSFRNTNIPEPEIAKTLSKLL